MSSLDLRAVDTDGAVREAEEAVALDTRAQFDHELTHVSALRRTRRSLGSKVPSAPSFDFKGTNAGDKFLPTAFALENVGVRGYLGQAGRLKSKGLLAAAASIATVEARHAAGIAALLNQTPYNAGSKSITPSGAFDRASGMKKILGEVGETGFITGS